jgi:hypothetical protein
MVGNSGHLGGYLKAEPAIGTISGFIGGYISAVGVASGLIGGYVFSTPRSEDFVAVYLGGFIETPIKQQEGRVGGICLSIPLTAVPNVYLGSIASGARENEAYIGGYVFGHPDYTDYGEAHARTLVKVRSKDVVDQNLNLDAQVVFKQISNEDFNAKFLWYSTNNTDFNARFKVENFQSPPTMQILSVTPASGGLGVEGCTQVSITASGILGDGTSWDNVQIDFGDPISAVSPTTFTPNMSISGFTGAPPWTTFHDYCASGLYVITIRGQDNKGMVGTEIYRLNLASGLSDDNFPKISISATPRFGEVPDALFVEFTTQSSGLPSPPFTQKESNNTKIQGNADRRVLWNLGNRETTHKIEPFTYYQSPGLYAPTIRFRYIHPSGGNVMWISDTLLLGFNR